MDPSLVNARRAHDTVVDNAFGAKTLLESNDDTERTLFQNHLTLTDERVRRPLKLGEYPLA